MVTFADSDGQREVAEEIVRTVICHAHRHAKLVAAALEATGLFRDRPVRLPAGFLLEFAAVLQLGAWESQGLDVHVAAGIPTFSVACQQLAERARNGPPEFEDPIPTPLMTSVLQILVRHFAWKGPGVLNADILLDDLDDDKFIDRLAEFLWTHRTELTTLDPDERS
jgi:hypothetical protein